MIIRKLICSILVLVMIFAIVSCGKKNETAGGASGEVQTAEKPDSQAQTSDDETSAPTETNGVDSTTEALIPGKLNIIDLDDRDPSILRGVTIKGNHAGSYDGINGKESSLTDVRCIFELNEWIEFYPDTDKEYALRVWILKHRDDQEYYNTAKFSDLDPNFVNYCDLHYPEDEDNPDEWYWGSFYLPTEECEPGYYDFVFTYEGKAIATLLTRFYAENELTVKSDAELEKLNSTLGN
jgi:hypothetical protein